jgi:hypothetical protein
MIRSTTYMLSLTSLLIGLSGLIHPVFVGASQLIQTTQTTETAFPTDNVTLSSAYTLSITKSATNKGVGTVISDPAGIDCGKACKYAYDSNSTVTLTATPDTYTVFKGWTGACTGPDSTCTVTMDNAKKVKATFAGPVDLKVTKVRQKGGDGTVASDVGDIDCGLACQAKYKLGSEVILTASASVDSVFLGWSGEGCTGSGSCTLSIDKAKTVKATFGGPSTSSPRTIDWVSYQNWAVGRAWQYQTDASEGTFSEYVAGVVKKNGYDVTALGWSANWSDQLDYWYAGPDGMYIVGFYDETQAQDVFFATPCLLLPFTVIPGTQYTQTCLDAKNAKVKVTFAINFEDGVTVPYGTFDDVLRVDVSASSDSPRIRWYAQGVGQIKAYKVKSDRTDELLIITDGNGGQPAN